MHFFREVEEKKKQMEFQGLTNLDVIKVLNTGQLGQFIYKALNIQQSLFA